EQIRGAGGAHGWVEVQRRSCSFCLSRQPSTRKSRNASYTVGAAPAARMIARRRDVQRPPSLRRRRKPMRNSSLQLSTLSALAAVVAAPAAADEPTIDELVGQGKFCSATAHAVFRACDNQTLDDYYIGLGVCINESDGRERGECLQDLKDSRDEATQDCAAQRTARTDLCKVVGEDRYDPEFEARDFDRDFRNLTNPNPYFPLTIGNRWEFRG